MHLVWKQGDKQRSSGTVLVNICKLIRVRCKSNQALLGAYTSLRPCLKTTNEGPYLCIQKRYVCVCVVVVVVLNVE